jgi:FeS assembly SUF system protein
MIKLSRLLGSALALSNPPPEREGANAVSKPFGEKRAEQGLKRRVIAALRTIHDPELPVNIYDLGLIYDIDIDAEGGVEIRMTLTTPACPVAQGFPAQVERTVAEVEGVTHAHVEIVWDPPWDQSRMSEAARLQLGLV